MRYALVLEYAGTGFSGWQSQANALTLQDTLEKVLARIVAAPVQVVCAGRTDAGVHATGQVVHFDTEAVRPVQAYMAGANAWLPKSMVIRWAGQVDTGFHARFSALSRSYRYVIVNTPMHSALMASRAGWVRRPLETEWMQAAANCLLGEHDFSTFRSSRCESRTPMRCVYGIEVWRTGDLVVIDLRANAFLHHMVRNITGALIRAGTGDRPPEWMAAILAARDRRQAAETAPASGLYLSGVAYPKPWVFPVNRNILFF